MTNRKVSTKIFTAKLDELLESDNNPRDIKKGEFERLKKSLREFPQMREIREIVVDENMRILGGHMRARALSAIGVKTATVKQVSGLTENQKQEFIIKDNAHSGQWDMDVLANRWDEIKLNDWGIKTVETGTMYYGDERERTYKAVNLDKYNARQSTGKYGIPTLSRCDVCPERFIGFNEARTSTDITAGVHFFIDDYQFERVWKSPEKYAKMLAKFGAVLTPDFSLYTDMPAAMKIWNVYRGRLIGQICQNHGLNVIPTIMFADEDTYEYAFDGLPTGGTFATSSVGVARDKQATEIWLKGMHEAIKIAKPDTLIIYGSRIGDFKPKCKCIYIKNERF